MDRISAHHLECGHEQIKALVMWACARALAHLWAFPFTHHGLWACAWAFSERPPSEQGKDRKSPLGLVVPVAPRALPPHQQPASPAQRQPPRAPSSIHTGRGPSRAPRRCSALPLGPHQAANCDCGGAAPPAAGRRAAVPLKNVPAFFFNGCPSELPIPPELIFLAKTVDTRLGASQV